jgi:hypothetical protein
MRALLLFLVPLALVWLLVSLLWAELEDWYHRWTGQ